MVRRIGDWLQENLDKLRDGEELEEFIHKLEGPQTRPDIFKRIIAVEHGQDEDWGWSVPSGGRVHAQVFRQRGIYRFHFDKVDPSRSWFHAAWHVAIETPLGIVVAAIAAVPLFRRIVRK